jgi:hypothetical protein
MRERIHGYSLFSAHGEDGVPDLMAQYVPEPHLSVDAELEPTGLLATSINLRSIATSANVATKANTLITGSPDVPG